MTPEPLIAFFEGYFRELEQQGWPAVILHTWQSLPQQIASDVDYLVTGVSPRRLHRFLNDYCRRKGWQLVQVMEHEPRAFYAVCYMTEPPWESVKLDVAWDYRRKGRKLLSGDLLLNGRRQPPGKAFQVPAPAAEFAYVFAKGLAKSKGAAPVIGRLLELWQEDPLGCSKVLERSFGLPTGTAGFPQDLVMDALRPDNARFHRWRARRWGLSQFRWLARRLRRAYGLTLAVNSTVDPAEVGETMQAAFRRFVVPGVDPGPWRRRLIEYRSTLIVGGPSFAGKPGVLDLTRQTSIDGCVAAALNHLHQRGGWAEGATI